MRGLQAEGGALTWQPQSAVELKSGEVRIRVQAAGLNRADLLQKAGMYPPPPGVTGVLGLECAGEVIEVAEGSRWQLGDRVCALLAGGGMRTGQVIGSTNRLGEHAKDRPVSFQEVLAMVYQQLGLDLNGTRMFDLRNRPQYLIDRGVRPMHELV